MLLSGGSGTRLWPLSRSSYPKQYLTLNKNSKYTLLQETYLRLKGIKFLKNPIIICNEEQRFIVAEQMRTINVEPESILLEPCGRNTASAIALAALIGIKEKNDPLLLVLASDHKIEKNKKFRETIEEGIVFANEGRLVTFGVIPSTSETGFGYIESIEELSKDTKSSDIKSFIEKPNKELVKKLLKDRHFTWNSGIFLFKASSIISELRKYQPEIVETCEKCLEKKIEDLSFRRIDHNLFKKSPNISIDIAVMEKTKLGTVIPLDVGWNDLGSWKSIWESSFKDLNNNSLEGRTIIKDVKNSYLKSDNRLLVGLGLNNIAAIDTEDAILIANKNSIDSLKDIIKELDENNYRELKINNKVHRPWGHFVSLMENKNWQAKKIEINPYESISLQMHYHRSEHWVIVSGKAKIEINNETFILNENESTYVPRGAKHRLSNPFSIPLILIEVQSGTYLGEDDIVRFEDKYKRNTDNSE